MRGGMSAVLVALFVGGPILPSAARAQEERPVLTLDEALEIAGRHNPAVRRAMNDLDLNEPALRASWGAFLPTLNFSLGTSAGFNRQSFAVDPLGRPIENPQAEWITTSSSSQGISSSILLFDGGRRRNQMRVARAQAGTRTAAVDAELVTLRAGVERSYLAAVQQRVLLEVEEDLLAARRRELESTHRLFEVAMRDQVDLLGAELAVQQQERQVEQVRGEARKAVLALRSQLGDASLPEFQLPSALPGVADPGGLDSGELVDRALRSSPRVRQQELAVGSARAGLSATRAQLRIPTVSLSGNFNRSEGGRDWDGFLNPNPTGSRTGGLSLGFQIPGFGGFSSYNQISQADVTLRNAVETERQTRLQVEEEVRGRLIDLERGWRSLQLAERSLEVAERRLELTREKFLLATATFQELESAAQQAAQERRNLITERFSFALARIALEEAVGAPLQGAGED
jgi:outer membrane protein